MLLLISYLDLAPRRTAIAVVDKPRWDSTILWIALLVKIGLAIEWFWIVVCSCGRAVLGGSNAKGKLIVACLKREGSLLILLLPSSFFFPLLPFSRPFPLTTRGFIRILYISCSVTILQLYYVAIVGAHSSLRPKLT